MKRRQLLWTVCKAVTIFAVFAFALYMAKGRTVDYIGANDYVTSDVVYADGSTAHFDDKDFGALGRGDVATLRLNLPREPLMPRATLMFYDYNAVTEVWFGETLLDSYGAELAQKGMMIGNHDFGIDIPDDAWGGEITIVVTATEEYSFSNFTNLKIYPTQLAYRYYIDNDPVGFVLSIALFIFSLMGLFACLISRIRTTVLRNGLSLALAALLISLWMISNKGIYNLFGMKDYFWQPLEYICGYAMVAPLLLFYYGMARENAKWHRTFGIATIVAVAFVTVSTVLNFTNLLHFDSLMVVAFLLIFTSGVLLLAYTVQTRKSQGDAAAMLRMGMYVFVPTCLYEASIRGVSSLLPLAFLHQLPSLLSVGILFLLLYMTGAFVSDLYDRQKELLATQIKVENLEQFFSTIPVGVCIFSIEGKLPILQANDMFFNIFGYDTEESARKAGFDSLSAFPLNQEDRMKVGRQYAMMMQGTQKMYEFELNIVKPDGSSACILSKYCQHSDDRKLVTASVVDITDRKRMEEELRVSEERYRLALQQSGKVFFFFDAPTRTMRLSEELAKSFGLPLVVDNMPDNFISLGLVEPESVENYRHFYERILAGEETGDTIISCHTRQRPQDVLWYKIAFTSIFDARHMPTSTIITYEDVSGQIAMKRNMDELQKELENSRIKVMVNQMQPHFLYNALSAIQTIVKSDPDYAYRLIYDFTVHLRSNIRALSSDEQIPFKDELKNIRAYMNIEQMRFGENLKVSYEIDCDDFTVIPLSIQPLAENAARHGVYPKGDKGGTVTIRSYEAVSSYIVEVEDDGVGFDIKEVLEKKSDSVGLKSLIFRLKSLMNADVAIDSKPGVGTRATVTIPKGALDE